MRSVATQVAASILATQIDEKVVDKIPDGQFKTFIAEASSATSSGIMGKAVSGVPLSLQSMATNAVGSSMGDEIGGEASSALDRSTPSVDEAPSSAPHQPAHTSYSSHDAEVDLQNISNINLKIPTLSFKEPVVSDANYAGYNLGEINRANIQNSQSASVSDTSPHSYLDDPVRAKNLVSNLGLFGSKPNSSAMKQEPGLISKFLEAYTSTKELAKSSFDALADVTLEMADGYGKAAKNILTTGEKEFLASPQTEGTDIPLGIKRAATATANEFNQVDKGGKFFGFLGKFGGAGIEAYEKFNDVRSGRETVLEGSMEGTLAFGTASLSVSTVAAGLASLAEASIITAMGPLGLFTTAVIVGVAGGATGDYYGGKSARYIEKTNFYKKNI